MLAAPDFDFNWIQILIFAVVILGGLLKGFYNIFVKPLTTNTPRRPPERGLASPPGSPPGEGGLKNFLEELRRDLGHGEGEQPRTDFLLEEEEEEEEEIVVFEETPVPGPSIPPAPRPAAVPLMALPSRVEEMQSARRALSSALSRRAGSDLAPILALSAEQPTSVDEPRALTKLLGTDLQTAIVLSEILGPPRALQNKNIRGQIYSHPAGM